MTFNFDLKVKIYMVYDIASCWATSSLPFKVPKVLVTLLCVKNFMGYQFYLPATLTLEFHLLYLANRFSTASIPFNTIFLFVINGLIVTFDIQKNIKYYL